MPQPWKFYGRQAELSAVGEALRGDRFSFLRVTGRRRIGKTTLLQRALDGRSCFYVAVPDSDAAGVLFRVRVQLEEFGLTEYGIPDSLYALAGVIQAMVQDGMVVVLDEFQYFLRKRLAEFCSLLQERVDSMRTQPEKYPGTLVVLGSIHTEISALLDDRDAPLYGRVTSQIQLDHLPIWTVSRLLADHGVNDPTELLTYWSLFEGVPKFYRDCFELGLYGASRTDLIDQLFFMEGSPLREEADQWFLKELRGRYDTILEFLARHPGATNAAIEDGARTSSEGRNQVGGYIQQLRERYGMVERRLPIFGKPTAPKGRYYITDNFLVSWLRGLRSCVANERFLPREELLTRADARLAEVEGAHLEKAVRLLLHEASRVARPGFRVDRMIQGWWDRKGVEIDVVAVDDKAGVIRFGTVKRNPEKAVRDIDNLERHAARFLDKVPLPPGYKATFWCFAPKFDDTNRSEAEARGARALDLGDLLEGLE